MEDRFKKIESEIELIKNRNLKVQADKAWETSVFRKLTITLVTYVIASVVLYFIGSRDYFLNALVPTVGYLLSVQSLPFIKRWWVKKYHNNEKV